MINESTLQSIKYLINADGKYNVKLILKISFKLLCNYFLKIKTGKNGILMLGRLVKYAFNDKSTISFESYQLNYENFLQESSPFLISILTKHTNELKYDLNFVDAIFDICLSISNAGLIDILISSNVLILLLFNLNQNATFDLIILRKCQRVFI